MSTTENTTETSDLPKNPNITEQKLDEILQRIPPRWGQYIDVGPGWYPIIIDLDQKLAQIEPDYILNQVKTKFGGLRYYFELPDLKCCQKAWDEYNRWAEEHSTATEHQKEDKLAQIFNTHDNTAEHKNATRTQQLNYKKMQKLVEEHEKLASQTCEETGLPGQLMVKGGWYATLNKQTGEKLGFNPVN